VSPLLAPPADLTRFPAFRLLPSQTLVRIHRAERGPWWFGLSGYGRFDLSPPRGTCYLAEDALGAFVEAFQEPGPVIPGILILGRRRSMVSVPAPMLLADCTDSRTRRFGLTGEIHSSDDRRQTQAWAEAFARAGFDGIRYFVRHDPAQRQVGFALFGASGAVHWPVESTDVVDADLIRDAQERFGIQVLSPPLIDR
jgi:RES domain